MPSLPLRLALPDADATDALAARLAPVLGAGDTLLLAGPVGAGKSAFARALIRTRLGDPAAEIPSPTFTLVQTYAAGDLEIWHADLYRLGHPDEAVELGLGEAFETALCLVEWPGRLGSLVPPGALTLTFAARSGGAHEVTLDGPAPWPDRLEGLT